MGKLQEPKNISEDLLEKLTKLGKEFGENVTIMAPIHGTQDQIISGKNFDKFAYFWRKFHGRTPGLILIEKSFSEFEPKNDDYIYLPLLPQEYRKEDSIEKFYSAILNEMSIARTQVYESNHFSFLRVVLESIEMKPSFMGIGVDVKKIVSHLINRPG